jgi:valyl-tRNA synthetase
MFAGRMEPEKNYHPSAVEDKWYAYWMQQGYFRSVPDEREPYTILIPPPNVTGVLHMGHMLNNTIQDILIRKARMEGKNACWVPGTDHASIATEAKVVRMLADQGIRKSDLTRDAFLNHAWEWTHKYGGIILEQLKKLGASCDWERTRFTMEPSLYDAVIEVFIDLYRKGLIYRGTRMVNWDPMGNTTLSDEEVIYKQEQSALYYLKYFTPDGSDFVTIATTRPETIMGDVAIATSPGDPRYADWLGKTVLVPLIGREIPIIADEEVDASFGTGCLKVTPCHDIVDYRIGQRHQLPLIDALNADGTLSEAAGLYVGEDRFVVRKKIAKVLETKGHLLKSEQVQNNVGHSERTDAVIEPRISTQWFMDMKSFMKRNPEVLEHVMNDTIHFFPAKFKNTYRHWIENIKDWNISRQLWWGHRIPAWYASEGDFEVAVDADEAAARFKERNIMVHPSELKQDEDVLDTWFSSWLWPISVFDGFTEEGKKDLDYYYPTNDLVTAPEIMFFWVARMIMAGYEYKRELPFRNVYYTGIVRDKLRRKMSKSLGNSPDPLDLIAQFGADGVRMGMLLSAPAGNDILFDESQVAQGRNFCNKLWNAWRLISGWQVVEDDAVAQELTEDSRVAAAWFEGRYQSALSEIHEHFAAYRLSDALMSAYKLVWDDFCSWYLEMVKPAFGAPIHRSSLENTRQFFESLMRVLHPFMPFITEELYHAVHNGNPEQPCILSSYPKPEAAALMNERPLKLISEVRQVRNSKGISPKEALDVTILTAQEQCYREFSGIISKLANCKLSINGAKPESAAVLLVETDELHVGLPAGLNLEEEKASIRKELDYLHGFLKSVDAKLSNERFVANAKGDVVEKERQKKADAEEKIRNLQSNLRHLEGK